MHRPVRPFAVTHRSVFRLAVPMTLAYLSVPLVGVIDTAVIGRLGIAALIGGIAVGAIVLDIVFTTFNFLRSGTTGLTAQAFGADDEAEIVAVLLRALIVALASGVVDPRPAGAVHRGGHLRSWIRARPSSMPMRDYLYVRIWATPFSARELRAARLAGRARPLA